MSTNGSKSLHNQLADVLKTLPRSGIRDFFDIVSSRKGVISLGVGEPMFTTPWHIREASVFALEKGATSYTSNLGLLELRNSLSRYVKQTFGLEYNPEDEIMITVGVSEALDLAVRALVNPGDEILFHEPCYVSYLPVISMAHGVPVSVTTRAENGFKLTREELEKKVSPRTKALLLNFPNNPTGASMTGEELKDIAAFCCEHDLVVITDEIYAELTYEGTHTSIAHFPGMKERTIFLHGFSKSWAMTGYRLGYSCAPPALTEAMMKIHQYTMLCAPILSQKAAIEALSQAREDINSMKDQYTRNRNFMFQAFQDMGLPCFKPQGAFYIFPSIEKFGLEAKEFALQLLEEENVAVVPGTAFGEPGTGHLRCSFATNLDDIKDAMVRMARFLEKLA